MLVKPIGDNERLGEPLDLRLAATRDEQDFPVLPGAEFAPGQWVGEAQGLADDGLTYVWIAAVWGGNWCRYGTTCRYQ